MIHNLWEHYSAWANSFENPFVVMITLVAPFVLVFILGHWIKAFITNIFKKNRF